MLRLAERYLGQLRLVHGCAHLRSFEIAAQLAMPVSTVKRRMHGASSKLSSSIDADPELVDLFTTA